MKLCWCTITVNDMDESLKFYQEIVGLPLNKRYPAGPGVEIAFLGGGETKVELISYAGRETVGQLEGVSLGFEVKSVAAKIKFLGENGIKLDGEIFQPNPHIKFFFIRDPNGLRIQFVENM